MTTDRFFIAFHLPSGITRYLMQVGQQLRRELPPRVVRWVRPKNMHLTLRFMGDTKTDLIRPISDQLTQIAARSAPATLQLSELGYFPNANRPNVMWAGVSGDTAQLATMRIEIDQMLDQFGFKRDRFGFTPHLTLCYFKKGVSKRPKQLPAKLALKQHAFTLNSFSLVRSERLPDGPRYTDVAMFEMGGAA